MSVAAPTVGRLRLAVVGGAVAIGLIVGVVLATSGGDETGSGPVISGRDTEQPAGSTDDEQATESSEVAGTAPTITVTAVQLDESGALKVTAEDLAAPSSAGAPTRLCALVTYSAQSDPPGQAAPDQAAAGQPPMQAFGCADPGASTDLVLDPNAATVGCAAVADRNPPAAGGTTTVAGAFSVTPVGPMQAGSYEVTVEAVSGFGDGCPPPEDGMENAAATSLTVEVSQ